MNGPSAMKLFLEKELEALTAEERRILLDRMPPGEEAELRESVAGILGEVRTRGDEALLEQVRRFDGVELEALEVPRERWVEAADALAPEIREALERASDNLETFHRAQLPPPLESVVEDGVTLGRRSEPLAAVGAYAPGGSAAYPSTVLMCVVPARVAGVEQVVVCSPPGPEGLPASSVLAACAVSGADRLFAVGGAGAIGAMAFGTATVPRADCIVGPGNKYVAEAKRQVAGSVRIDSPAGPSEVLVVADETAAPRLVALEMVAQAEHDPDAAAVCVTPSRELAGQVNAALEAVAQGQPRREIIEAALASRGAILVARDRDEALAFASEYAPEHLLLLTAEPDRDLDRVRNAGTVFLGAPSSVVFGDYMTGANHVLPTLGLARSFAGLSTGHFMREATWQRLSPSAAAAMSRDTAILARAEGLAGHAAAAMARAGGRRSPPTADPGKEEGS